MLPGKRWALPDTPDGRLEDLVETAKAHKNLLRDMAKKHHKVKVLATSSNLFLDRLQLPLTR
ncbi:MAG: hypothetical protein QUV07_01740 [Cyanobium sp. CZS 25K]|nr:hypothetical protein [Cyanobium sp. CZS25K]